MVEIAKAKLEDIDSMLEIYQYAREFMARNGNPDQWGDGYPQYEDAYKDVTNENAYIIRKENKIVACFTLIFGVDPTYLVIKDGKWLNDKPYATIHRIASNGEMKGVFKIALDYALTKINNIRIDTYKDNLIMQHLIEKNGFKYCGIIFIRNNGERMAFQLDKGEKLHGKSLFHKRSIKRESIRII